MNEECETCIKRKTVYCPTSIECMATDDKPYYQNRIMLLEENQELKKQLTTYQILHRDCKVDNLKNISKIEEMENQQKEFIKFLEDNWKQTQDIWYIKILQKYKEIIGSDINVGSIGGKE